VRGLRARSFGATDPKVGPLLEQGAVEALHLAVGLRLVLAGRVKRWGDPAGRAELREGGAAVGGAVIGEHRLGNHAACGEPDLSPSPERRRRYRAFVCQHLAVGEAGVVFDRRVDVSAANPLAPARPTAAVCLPASARGIRPSFLMYTCTKSPGWACS
jgi:hypothetical protein